MSVRSALVLTCALLPVLSLAGETRSQENTSCYELSRRPGIDDNKQNTVWVAAHPQLNLEYEFGAGGMKVQPRRGKQDTWNWGLQLVGFGGEGGLRSVGPVLPRVAGNRVEYRRPGLLEWYIHDRRGVEQGFTIETIPEGAGDRMRVELAVSGTLVPSLTAGGGSLLLRDAEGTTALRYDNLYAFDAAGRNLPVWMELRENGGSEPHLALWVDIREADFPVTIDPLISPQVAKMTASDAAALDEFGASVAISGDTLVVGARGNDDAGDGSGSAYVFQRNAGGADNWGQVAKLTASDGAAFNQFGSSVAISGDTVVVGAPGNNLVVFQPGSAYVFQRNAGGVDNWGQVAKLTASDPAVQDQFGLSVSISGDTVVVGAPQNDDVPVDSGSAYVFERNAGGVDSWGEVVKLVASDATGRDRFGKSVSISVDAVVVGSPLDDDAGLNSGSVYVFERNAGGAGTWGEVSKIGAADAAAGAQFGHAVSISGGLVAVGALGDQSVGIDSGAYVFELDSGGAGSWSQLTKLLALDRAAGDRFGDAVSISGDTVVVGANGHDGVSVDSGSAYVFQRNAGGAESWGQVSKLMSSDGASGDRFGIAVSISGGTVVAGADLDDVAGLVSGSAYAFTFSGSSCLLQEFAKFVPLDAGAPGRFGHSIAISGNAVVVGAPSKVIAYVKVGAAYVHGRNTGGAEAWGQVAMLIAPEIRDFRAFGWSVSISGDTVVVGEPGQDPTFQGMGAAYVFQQNAGGADNWGQVAKLTSPEIRDFTQFGIAVSISGDTVVVGEPVDGLIDVGSGAVYVFQRHAGGADNWGMVAKLTASDAAFGDFFGNDVAISGDTVVAGAIGDDDAGSRSGSSYVFERNVGGIDNWGEVAKMTASDAASQDNFGRHLAISGDTVVVGVSVHSHGGSGSGSSYVFDRDMGGTDSWGEVEELTVSADKFGLAIAISGDTVVAGAQGGGDSGFASGSSYVFERNVGGADSWGLVDNLAASSGAWFGSVAISGGSIVAGASGAAFAFEYSCAVCGDGLRETPEECDDGAANSGLLPDACRTDCSLPTCGDLVVDTGEECDDANLTDNDGCDSNCTFTACGNGVVTVPEECDDGNAVPGDGCDVSCLLECFDNDGDGFGAPGAQCTGGAGPDCDDGDNLIWGTPGEAMNLTFTDVSSMTWDSPSDLGGTVVAYDVLRSPLVRDFRVSSALCVESNDGPDTTATDTTIPDANTVLYYLIRAENACPDTGQGSPGNWSSGALRSKVRLCP